ncbi:MAG: CBS domain-containing protein [Oceanococcus sp.]
MLHNASVRDYMAANLVTFKPQQDLLQAIHLLLENGISGAPVTDSLGNIIGLLSEKDCISASLKAGYEQQSQGKVEDFMTRDVKTVDAEDSILTVAKLFIETPYKRYPVMDDNALVGQISRRDVLRAIQVMSQG